MVCTTECQRVPHGLGADRAGAAHGASAYRNRDREVGSLDLLKSGFLCQASSELMGGQFW